MANNLQENILPKQKEPKQKNNLKLIVILVAVIILIALAIYLIVFNSKSFKISDIANINLPGQDKKETTPQDEYLNFDAPIPADKIGDISNVPKEELNTLFEKLNQ